MGNFHYGGEAGERREREREREEKKLEFNGPSSIVTSLNSGNL
jgi:hypothetical protein